LIKKIIIIVEIFFKKANFLFPLSLSLSVRNSRVRKRNREKEGELYMHTNWRLKPK